MTNKEAIEILDKITAIKALEELCDDCCGAEIVWMESEEEK